MACCYCRNAIVLPFKLGMPFLLMLVVGCGETSPFTKVQGVVTLNGKPVPNATVAFRPTDGGHSAYGVTKEDGSYELSSLKPGDGALPGTHRVTVTAVDVTQDKEAEALAEEYGSLSDTMPTKGRKREPKKTWRVPQAYSEADTSGLEFTVEEGGDNQADFQLKSSP